MIIALFTNTSKENTKPVALGVYDYLISKGIRVVSEPKTAAIIGTELLSSVYPKEVDFLITLGGDGTILHMIHGYPELTAPILGINMGGLGFMAEITIEEIYFSLDNLLKGHFQIQNRLMMEVENLNKERYFAVNEIVVHRAQNPSLIDLAIYVDGNYLTTYAADGIIIATPNGSTAYSLAAGGPILAPEIDAYVITPICPHTLSNRPIVLNSKQEIEIKYLSEYPSVEVIYDGFGHFLLHPGEIFKIRNSSRHFSLVNMLNYDFYSTLRTKLGWAGRLKK